MLHLSKEQVADIQKLADLLDACVYHNVENGSVISPTDGNIEFVFSLGNSIQRAKNTSDIELTVIVYASMIEKDVLRFFYSSVNEALEDVTGWHKSFFPEKYEDVRVSQQRANLRIVK